MTTDLAAALTHLGFYVTDIDAVAAFYTGFMGMIVTDRGEGAGRSWVFMSRDPQEHHQIVIASGRPADSFQQINQISFRVPDLATLRRWHARAADAQCDRLEAVSHGNSWSIYFHDPEGNRIEMYASSHWYVSQPMRVPVDMTRSVAQLIEENDQLTDGDPSRRPHDQWVSEMQARLADA